MSRPARFSGGLRRFFLLLTAAAVLLIATGGGIPSEVLEDVNGLPLWLLEETAEPGKLVMMEYTSQTDKGTPAQAGVYLPYGYDPAGKYDVIILWPGTDGGTEIALTTEHKCRMEDKSCRKLSVVHILDRMIEQKLIRPVLVVCVEEITRSKLAVARVDLQTVLDLVTENYATYASDKTLSPAELRKHFAFMGFSQGAVYTQTLAMAEFFDRFANFASISFGSRSPTGAKAMNESPYELGMLYFITGNDKDVGAETGGDAFRGILWRCPEKAQEGVNAIFRLAWFYIHDYALIQVAMVDMLPRIWPGKALTGGWQELSKKEGRRLDRFQPAGAVPRKQPRRGQAGAGGSSDEHMGDILRFFQHFGWDSASGSGGAPGQDAS